MKLQQGLRVGAVWVLFLANVDEQGDARSSHSGSFMARIMNTAAVRRALGPLSRSL